MGNSDRLAPGGSVSIDQFRCQERRRGTAAKGYVDALHNRLTTHRSYAALLVGLKERDEVVPAAPYLLATALSSGQDRYHLDHLAAFRFDSFYCVE